MLPALPDLKELRRDQSAPLYRQLTEQIQELVTKGQLKAGARLPASRQLAQQLGISRLSVVRAYEELRQQGLLSARAGKGTFVNEQDGQPPPPARPQPAKSNGEQRDELPNRALHDLMFSSATQAGVICFASGSAPLAFSPLRPLRAALDAVLDRDGAQALGYEPTAGYPPLRRAVRDYVRAQGIRCEADDVIITGGAQQAMDLVLQAWTTAANTVLTTEPTYLGLIDSACARGLDIIAVPGDDDGPCMLELETALLAQPDSRPALIFVMPSFHNPTGAEMSLARRRQLLRIAQRYQVPILEDGVFSEFRYRGESLPPIKALDEHGIVIHISTFSKNLLPGMRVGYIIARAEFRKRLELIKHAADIATASLNQRVIHWLLGRGVIASQLGRNLREMTRRRDAALAAAARYFPRSWRWQEPAGGFFLWVTLPENGPTASELYVKAITQGVSFAIGDIFYTGAGGSRNLRINFVEQDAGQIACGFQRLGQAWRELHPEGLPRARRPLL